MAGGADLMARNDAQRETMFITLPESVRDVINAVADASRVSPTEAQCSVDSVDFSQNRAVIDLRTYYSHRLGVPGEFFTGAYFDRFASDGADPSPYAFTWEDIGSLPNLSVNLNAPAALEIMRFRPETFNQFLEQIDPGADLTADPSLENPNIVAALNLERELRKLPDVGAVIASKLIASKRPKLFPIYDQHVVRAAGTKDRYLAPLINNLAEQAHLTDALRLIKQTASVGSENVCLNSEISDIRALDVILWTEGRRQYKASHG